MTYFRLSEKDFNHVLGCIRMSERPRLSARLVVVNGFSFADASKQLGITREAVRKSVLRVKSAWEALNDSSINSVKHAATGMLKAEMQNAGIPDDWEPVVVYLPKKMANSIRVLEEDKLQILHSTNG